METSATPLPKPKLVQKSNESFIYYIVLGVVGIILLFGSFYIIPSGKIGLESTLGVYQKQYKSPGLYFKLPIFQGITKVDVKSKIAHYGTESSDKAESSSGVINLPQITVLDEKNLDISMQISIRYKVNPDNIYDIYINDGGNFFNKRINPIVLEETRNVLGKYRADSVATKKGEISTKIKTALRAAFEKEVFFFIEDVNVRRFSLDPIIKKRIAAVESANQKEKELQYEVKQAEQRKQISIKDAQAKAESILIEARAQAQANTLLAKSLTSSLVKIKEIEKWDGKLPTVSGSSSGVLMNMPTK